MGYTCSDFHGSLGSRLLWKALSAIIRGTTQQFNSLGMACSAGLKARNPWSLSSIFRYSNKAVGWQGHFKTRSFCFLGMPEVLTQVFSRNPLLDREANPFIDCPTLQLKHDSNHLQATKSKTVLMRLRDSPVYILNHKKSNYIKIIPVWNCSHIRSPLSNSSSIQFRSVMRTETLILMTYHISEMSTPMIQSGKSQKSKFFGIANGGFIYIHIMQECWLI